MTLSSSLPREEELENVLKDARYRVIKKSGFAASTQYAKDQRKRDLYVIGSRRLCYTDVRGRCI